MKADAFEEDEPPEHVRFAAYLHVLEQVTDDELSLVAEILTDPDPEMAQSAVVRYLEWRAVDLIDSPRYPSWSRAMVSVVEGRPFLVQRLHEWSLFRAAALAHRWDPSALTESSEWLQRRIVENLDSSDALTVLAESGRTIRVRTTAKTKLT